MNEVVINELEHFYKESDELTVPPTGLTAYNKFRDVFVAIDYVQIAIFRDGSWAQGSEVNQKIEELGRPILVIRPELFRNVPPERLASIADDINEDVLWIQRAVLHEPEPTS